MKITDVQCHVASAADATGQVRRNYVFIRVLTDQPGMEGCGEATTEHHEMAIAAHVQHELRPRLLGLDPTNVEHIWQKLHRQFWWRRGVVHTSAISGVDIALWDIAAKAAGLPLFKMLGGQVRRHVRLYVRYGPEMAGKDHQQAAEWATTHGYRAFKHGVGAATTPFHSVRQVQVALDEHARFRALLPDAELMIDCAGLFDMQSAHQLLDGLREHKLLFVEEPTAAMDTPDSTRQLKQTFGEHCIALGERLCTRWDFAPWFERRAMDVCHADVCHCGGISELMRIAHHAETYGITMAPHNPYGPVATAACAHACAAMSNFLILEHCPMQPSFDLVQRKLNVPIADGQIDVGELATRPGLGVDLDWHAIAARPYVPLQPLGYEQRDGSIPLI